MACCSRMVGDAQGQAGLLLLGDGLGPGHDLFQPGRELVDLLEEILPGQRQFDMGCVALQQGDVQFLFQGADLAADGCLGHKAGPRRLGKAAGAGYPLKVHDLLQCHTLFLLPASKLWNLAKSITNFLCKLNHLMRLSYKRANYWYFKSLPKPVKLITRAPGLHKTGAKEEKR